MYTLWLDAAEFENKGGRKLETQFVRAVGQSYLIADDMKLRNGLMQLLTERNSLPSLTALYHGYANT